MTLEAALSAMRVHDRIIACGGILGDNAEKPQPGPSNLFNMITKRLTMKGLLVGDWLDRQGEFAKEVGGYFRAGKLKKQGNGGGRHRPGGWRFPRFLYRKQLGEDGGEVDLSRFIPR